MSNISYMDKLIDSVTDVEEDGENWGSYVNENGVRCRIVMLPEAYKAGAKSQARLEEALRESVKLFESLAVSDGFGQFALNRIQAILEKGISLD